MPVDCQNSCSHDIKMLGFNGNTSLEVVCEVLISEKCIRFLSCFFLLSWNHLRGQNTDAFISFWMNFWQVLVESKDISVGWAEGIRMTIISRVGKNFAFWKCWRILCLIVEGQVHLVLDKMSLWGPVLLHNTFSCQR